MLACPPGVMVAIERRLAQEDEVAAEVAQRRREEAAMAEAQAGLRRALGR